MHNKTRSSLVSPTPSFAPAAPPELPTVLGRAVASIEGTPGGASLARELTMLASDLLVSVTAASVALEPADRVLATAAARAATMACVQELDAALDRRLVDAASYDRARGALLRVLVAVARSRTPAGRA